ncbi:6-bladed beta-propeller [Parabacteroides bouchesdurhonensis]|uniref:6-bladed beta-propeller n=1 Tax=Parabacteroides bouchesdurhonensis TaxID=1936995 RepID=UPI00164D349B|nr:6-bladed beta-propeller [Parabacteroides bouchesdurhonensis]
MKNAAYLYLFVIIPFFFSCNNKQKKRLTLADCPVIANKTDSLITLDFSSVKETFNVPLSIFLSDYEIVRLENSKEAMIGHLSAIAISENYIGLFTYQIGYKLFNRKGEHICSISSEGQGPDEYWIAIYDSYIDEENGRIYLLSYRANKLLVFDLEGNPLQHIPFSFPVHKGRFQIDAKKKELTMTAVPFIDTPFVVWRQDFEGNILQSINAGHFVIDPGDYSNDVNHSQNTSLLDFSLFHWDPIMDSIYHYSERDNVLKPVFTVKWKDENVLRHIYTELSSHYFIRLVGGGASWDGTVPRYPLIIVDKNSLQGCYANLKFDMLGNIDGPSWLTFNRGYCITNMFPYELKEQLEKALSKSDKMTPEMKEKLIKLNNSLTEDDNNVLFIGKLKL